MAYDFLNPVFGFLLDWPSWLAILFVALIFTLLTTIVYKYTTNQREIKDLREKQKKLTKEIREVSRKDPKKAMGMQKKSLDISMQLMRHSFSIKSILYTLIPIILVFGWFNGHFAYEPIMPGNNFTARVLFNEGATGNITLSSIPALTITDPVQQISNNAAKWTLSGAAGDYMLTFTYQDKEYQHKVRVTTERAYEEPRQPVRNSDLKELRVENMPARPLKGVFLIGGAGWLITYILFSIILSIILRKVLDVA